MGERGRAAASKQTRRYHTSRKCPRTVKGQSGWPLPEASGALTARSNNKMTKIASCFGETNLEFLRRTAKKLMNGKPRALEINFFRRTQYFKNVNLVGLKKRLVPQRFTKDTFDPVTMNGQTDDFLGNGDQKDPLPNPALGALSFGNFQ